MSPSSEIPLVAFPTGNPPRWIQVAPAVDRHGQESRRMILAAAEQVLPEQAIVLGAGLCQEIPLRELVLRFRRITMNDLDKTLLEQAVKNANLTAEQVGKLDMQVTDLTGAADLFVQEAAQCLEKIAEPNAAMGRLAEVAEAIRPTVLEDAAKYDLVIASCVLCQLHVASYNRVVRLFAAKFPGHERELGQSQPWSQAVYNCARRMEAAFMTGLHRLVTPNGRIYLSDTVQVAFVHGTPNGQWATPRYLPDDTHNSTCGLPGQSLRSGRARPMALDR